MLRAVVEAGLEPGMPIPRRELEAVAQIRPVVVELHFNLGPGYHAALAAAGPFARLGPSPAAAPVPR